MKFGILTYQRAINYGAILQMIALYTYIRVDKNIKDISIIDYRSPFIEKHYKPLNFFDFFNLNRLKSIFVWNSYSFLKREVFTNYLKKYDLVFTKPISSKEFSEHLSMFDKIIVGSDQVWNPYANNFDRNYFLPFDESNTKKYSFSASIGTTNFDSKIVKLFIDYLPKFNLISLRENSSVLKLKSLISNEISHNLDPTLLFDSDFWTKYTIEFNDFIDKSVFDNFILVYLIVEDPLILNEAIYIAKINSLKVLYITDRFKKPQGTINISNLSPGHWLYLFSKAKFVFTNSYHGLIFSFTFRKKCFLKLLPEPAKVNSRITELISFFEFKFENHNKFLVFDFTTISASTLEILKISRLKSDSYLDMIIND